MGDDCSPHFGLTLYGFVRVVDAIFGSGFQEVTAPSPGKCMSFRRYQTAPNGETVWNAMHMKAYETPNLIG